MAVVRAKANQQLSTNGPLTNLVLLPRPFPQQWIEAMDRANKSDYDLLENGICVNLPHFVMDFLKINTGI
ncbi:hypothetical protein [Sphingobacterium multivorum]|uniref:Uncharacterized protein n=1 Tax=Sphingobacterium multivorum TaxID=28454 RepID=A0ABX7CU71_SPHMU|nr:hypothetical protein [Sphingobacterium multivorum]QQT54815.1 hypothetical protein I6I98_06055 [Sphingobacterium multivorum]